MRSGSLVSYIEIRVFVHATEDKEKVLKATRNLFPIECGSMVVFNETHLTGYYGNPITLLEATITDKEIIRGIVQAVSEGLSGLDKETLASGIDGFVEKGNLYLRMDKQAASVGSLRLCQADPIRMRIHFERCSVKEIIDICRSFGMLP